MKFKNIHIIINPASGTEEPILSYLNKSFENSGSKWSISVVHEKSDIKNSIKQIIKQSDLIVVYGGDGTVVEVAQHLIGKDIPLAILPGGTANILAKELGIGSNTLEAIALINNPNNKIIKIDTGLMNDIPFLIRVNFGIMAEMVSNTDRNLKNNFGQFAYGISAFQTLIEAEPIKFKMKIDGVEIKEHGVSLTITNSGNIGIEGYEFLPDISIEDGYFDVILLDQSNFLSVLKVAGSILLQTESEVLKRWKCKNITIKLPKSHAFICDDAEMKAKEIKISIKPKSLNVLVPLEKNSV